MFFVAVLYAPPETYINARLLLKAGQPMSKPSNVEATCTGVPYDAPPFVDLTMKMNLFVVVGQNPNTSPALFVLTSAPIAVPVDSAPLTWIGAASHVPAAPAVRRFM